MVVNPLVGPPDEPAYALPFQRMVPSQPRIRPCILLILLGTWTGAQSTTPSLPPGQETRALALLVSDPTAAALVIDSMCTGSAIKDQALRCAYLQAALLGRTGKLPEAWHRIREADTMATSDPQLKSQVKNFVGRIAHDNDEFDAALAAYHEVLTLTPPSDTMRIAVTYNNLGRVYERLKEYGKAFDALEKSVGLYEHLGDTRRLAGSLLNLGVVYYDQKRYPEAEERITRSLAFARELGMSDVESIALESLGNVQRKTARYAEALANYEASMAIAEHTGSQEGKASVSRNIGELYLDQGEAVKALPYLERTLALADSMGSRNYRQDAYFYLSKAFSALKRHPEALSSLEQYMAVKDSVLSEEKNKAIIGWQERLGTAEKERTILEQQVQAERDRDALRLREQQLWVLGIGILAVLLVVALLLRDRSRARKLSKARIAALEQEQRITAMRSMLEGAEQERERVAGELHDGVGILLSAARMRVGTDVPGSREKAGSLLEEAASEVRRISHALMPGSLMKLGLPEALRELAEGINGSGKMHVAVHAHGFRERLTAEQETGLYRIAQEAVNNALKHAHATHITIEVSVEDGSRVHLMISDDGRGFVAGSDHHGHGLENIRTRAALLGGTSVVRSSADKGTTWEIEVPIMEKHPAT